MRKYKAGAPYHPWEIEQLRSDRELAIEYLKVAMECLDNPEERAGGLLALRSVAEAYGGLGVVAAQAGISRESLYRALSPLPDCDRVRRVAHILTIGTEHENGCPRSRDPR